MTDEFVHGGVDHANKYVDGRIHTNGLENFWSLLKRGISGTYVAVEPLHLFRYLDEQSFRYNNRGTKKHPTSDAKRFEAAMNGIVGKRLTYAGLTGKVEVEALSAESERFGRLLSNRLGTEHENNNASECSEALQERSAVSLNITLRAEKV